MTVSPSSGARAKCVTPPLLAWKTLHPLRHDNKSPRNGGYGEKNEHDVLNVSKRRIG